MRSLRICKLGRVEYRDGLALMEAAAAGVRSGDPPDADWLFLLEHPPVITLGRGAAGANVLASPAWLERQGFEIHQTDRGGDVTYHGPGQVVGYPVLDLAGRKDVRRYVSDLEEAMIRTCADFGVTAGRYPEHRGAWVGSRKIGAVGVHLSRWITTHGFAFNVSPDLSHFQVIVPCGIADPRLGVTSLADVLGSRGQTPPSLGEAEERLAAHFTEVFGRERLDHGFDLRTVSVVPLDPDGRVLLLRRTPERGGSWQQVTGRIQPGEAPEAAARRELTEETGADAPVRELRYRHAFALDPALAGSAGPSLRLVDETAFAARLPAGFAPRLSAEHAEWKWLTPGEAVEAVRHAGLKKAIRLAAAAPAP